MRYVSILTLSLFVLSCGSDAPTLSGPFTINALSDDNSGQAERVSMCDIAAWPYSTVVVEIVSWSELRYTKSCDTDPTYKAGAWYDLELEVRDSLGGAMTDKLDVIDVVARPGFANNVEVGDLAIVHLVTSSKRDIFLYSGYGISSDGSQIPSARTSQGFPTTFEELRNQLGSYKSDFENQCGPRPNPSVEPDWFYTPLPFVDCDNLPEPMEEPTPRP